MRDASRMTMEWNLGMRTIHGFIYTLRLYERGVRETLGRYTGFVMPDLGFQIPLAHITRVGSVQALKRLERIENLLRDNAKIVITEQSISPTLLLGSLPVEVSSGNGKGVKLIKANRKRRQQ